MSQAKQTSPSITAQGLGYGGLVPFVGLALLIEFWPLRQAQAATALLAYSATIASFLGAIHWGLTMRDPQSQNPRMLAWGVVPSLVAWVALMLPPSYGLLLIAFLLWACLAFDRVVYTGLSLRAWLPMRLLLTTIASLSCIASALVLMGGAQ
ncbi:MAG: DUF3429 domain-containing protein [Burkholderiales bacterium PBB4]|nr:MAG: DUF3429 domain-containing protein [Burkholderiales bacterium PBB4]